MQAIEVHDGEAHLLAGLLFPALDAALDQALLPLLKLPDVCQCQLKVDDVDVRHRVNLAGDVDDIVVLKTPHDLRGGEWC